MTHHGEHLDRPSFRVPLCFLREIFYQKCEPRPGTAGHFLEISGKYVLLLRIATRKAKAEATRILFTHLCMQM